ncbi:hypothetical protein DACRYDRAFT_101460 [Dacryopinax primogenitus]|uniref:Uncharacterized protein n=1 Tax=Dacryopinax primogenitus (strain DJM 731) TaxID=1858805 RepID=M5G6I3_DACPD|nr:uncharacterized protein DACRYDRAFT_101460 [Dacryopinax primogenitus]EJT99377.1 hypothetical protein DACRYDRAFT_101460 [Dacryopinax primogenitus]
MAAARLSAPALIRLERIIQQYSTVPLYPGYVPVPAFTIVHSVRTYVAWAQATKATGAQGKLGFLQGLFGYLVVSWSGMTMSCILLVVPPIWMYNAQYFLTYVCAFCLLSIGPIPDILCQLPAEPLAILDGFYRTSGAIGMMQLAQKNPSVGLRTSPLTVLVLGAVTSGGGTLVIPTFGLAELDWTLRTPPVLKGDIWTTLDLWAGAVVVAVYAFLSEAHPGLNLRLLGINGMEDYRGRIHPWFSEAEAKVIAIIVGITIFSLRAGRPMAKPVNPTSKAKAAKAAEKRHEVKDKESVDLSSSSSAISTSIGATTTPKKEEKGEEGDAQHHGESIIDFQAMAI